MSEAMLAVITIVFLILAGGWLALFCWCVSLHARLTVLREHVEILYKRVLDAELAVESQE